MPLQIGLFNAVLFSVGPYATNAPRSCASAGQSKHGCGERFRQWRADVRTSPRFGLPGARERRPAPL